MLLVGGIAKIHLRLVATRHYLILKLKDMNCLRI